MRDAIAVSFFLSFMNSTKGEFEPNEAEVA